MPETDETYDEETFTVMRLLMVLAAVTVIIVGFRLATSVLTTVFLAFVITVSVTPLLHWLQRRGLPSWLAFAVVFSFVIVIMLVLVLIIFVSIQRFINTLPAYEIRIDELKQSLRDWLSGRGINPDDVSDFFSLNDLQTHNMIGFVTGLATDITQALSNWMFILFVAAMMLFESIHLPDKLKKGVREGSPMPQRVIDFNKDIRSYFILSAWLGFLAAALETVFLLLLGVDFALLWGVLSFLFSFVPYIGFIVSFVPPMLFALLEFGLGKMIAVVVGYVVINTVVDNILTPRVMARGLNLSPVVVVLSVLFWSWVMGPLGAVLSVPMTLMVKELVLEPSEARWLANLME
jgi:predicted PurR-regulated permease PerM